jgi:hypothetical protein
VTREVGEGGGRLLTDSEEDGGFDSLSDCDLDGDGLRGGRKEVSAAAEGSECGSVVTYMGGRSERR